jgi:hypothetical protein
LYALQIISEKIGKPVYAINPANMMGTSKDTPPNFIGLTPASTIIGKKLFQLIRILMDQMTLSDGMKRYNIMRKSYGLQPYNGSFWDISTNFSTLFFQSGVPEFEYHRSDLSP